MCEFLFTTCYDILRGFSPFAAQSRSKRLPGICCA